MAVKTFLLARSAFTDDTKCSFSVHNRNYNGKRKLFYYCVMKRSESNKNINSAGSDIQKISSLDKNEDSGHLIKNVSEKIEDNSRIENIEGQKEQENMKINEESLAVNSVNTARNKILDHIQNCSAVFKNQQIGEPELTISDKRSLAENLLLKNPSNFLTRFGLHLSESHLEYFYSLNNPEVAEHANQVRIALQSDKKLQQKNRRYEAMKRLEAEGSYFSEVEMEKREPLLYHQLVGQFLTEKEKLLKSRQSNSNIIPTFSNFLIEKMERDEIRALRRSQQEIENSADEEMSEEDNQTEFLKQNDPPRWGDDWVDAENSQKHKKEQKKKKKVHLSLKEKTLLLEEFKSLMHSKFLNGLDREFNYADVDMNPEYDSLETKSQDAEDKYFDEESCSENICTDTGIEDY